MFVGFTSACRVEILPTSKTDSQANRFSAQNDNGEVRNNNAKMWCVILENLMPQVVRSPKVYDVCIIGSGAAGGTAAKVLTEGGLNVVMLEAGPAFNPEKDYKEHVWPYQLPHRGGGIGGKLKNGVGDEFMPPNGAWEIEGEPYT